MKSVFGTIILQSAGIFSITKNRNQAEKDLIIARKIYPDFKISLLDLSIIEDKLKVIDIDPDLADLNEGFIILVEVPDNIG
ncbi:hypothetical protein [Acidianus manzaensis]|uniref:Uncharacterized protein n=1 Tax=Acidianus manzaensis TaxID=282676 RepID=A0A1W6K0J9_9CREN|nr:hypothetical protein [Acidianus manzaensis]ARM76012.1 hypothetical protein B6F84_08235 [Acidianus manzaensis]